MYLLVFILLFFYSCSLEKVSNSEVVARVNNTTLTKEALSRIIGSEIAGPKTFLHATNAWVEKTLLYRAAIEVGLKKDRNLINKKEAFYKDLLVYSYIDIKTKNKKPVLKKDISNYYNKNKKSFTRAGAEVTVKHFVSKTKSEAENIKKILKKYKSGKKIEKIVEKYSPETLFLSEDLKKDNLVGFVFGGGVEAVVGPKKHSGFYHVFQILKKYKKGSIKGLEFVYDEIYQRISKQNELELLSVVLDSLYINSDVFISPGVFE
tara:strand:+ start:616 stop:1404 length:789 start_codon:yes stop_codon:yes gene_type:complete